MSDQHTPSTDPFQQAGATSAATDGHRGTPDAIVGALTDVSERVQTLVHEEIELAKAELGVKAKRAVTGAVVGISAGVFAVFGLLLLLEGLAWLAWFELFPDNQFFWGFFLVAAILFLLGAIAGFVAARAIRRAVPPAPTMAIDEAKLIRETMTAPQPETLPAPGTEVRR
ncbi:MAG TPA: phage holin family protein [Solirubrobacteraceae bacterium]|nr:phage holin family protein [Solirubrobacteraceae bacterium]